MEWFLDLFKQHIFIIIFFTFLLFFLFKQHIKVADFTSYVDFPNVTRDLWWILGFLNNYLFQRDNKPSHLVEYSSSMGWNCLWLETNNSFVCTAVKGSLAWLLV